MPPKQEVSMGNRLQVNVLLSAEEIKALDLKRIALQRKTGTIPSRSEVVRLALQPFIFARRSAKKR
jgi:uncharacterized membrane protein